MHATPPCAPFACFRHKHGFQAALFRPPQINPRDYHQDGQRRGSFQQIVTHRADHHIAVDFVHRVIPALTARHRIHNFCRIGINGNHSGFIIIVHTEYGDHIICAWRNILHYRSSFRIHKLSGGLSLSRQRLHHCLRRNMYAFAFFTGNIGE